MLFVLSRSGDEVNQESVKRVRVQLVHSLKCLFHRRNVSSDFGLGFEPIGGHFREGLFDRM
jgi:hypothetical protein